MTRYTKTSVVLLLAVVAAVVALLGYNREADTPSSLAVRSLLSGSSRDLGAKTDKVLFMHLGKGGGGSVLTVERRHDVQVNKCHPYASSCTTGLKTAERVLINIRDPVDRFVSAFNWRALVLCAKKDPRPSGGSKGTSDPHHFCKKKSPKEVKLLHEEYHFDVNEFAKALCLQGPKGDKARQHATMIEHLNQPIVTWVHNFLTPAKGFPKLQEFVAMVMEDHDYPFEETISHALRYTLGEEHIKANYTGWDTVEHKEETDKEMKQEASKMHSSASEHFFPNGKEMKKLSDVGSCCVARYLHRDYEVLKEIAGMVETETLDPRLRDACQWGTAEDTERCINSIRSMVQRRESYFTSMESLACDDAVASR